jgi:hypothetical protein
MLKRVGALLAVVALTASACGDRETMVATGARTKNNSLDGAAGTMQIIAMGNDGKVYRCSFEIGVVSGCALADEVGVNRDDGLIITAETSPASGTPSPDQSTDTTAPASGT